jgi:hypothetical protein
MSQERTWQHGSIAHQYTLIVGHYQAQVWQQTTGDWAALISREHTAVNSHVFRSLIAAQGWCEEQFAMFQGKA